MAKLDLERIGKDKFICGMIMVEHDGATCLHTYVTMNIDNKLEGCVNPENASEDNRYIKCTMADALRDLGKYDKDELCEYFLTYSDNNHAGCHQEILRIVANGFQRQSRDYLGQAGRCRFHSPFSMYLQIALSYSKLT